MTKDFEIIYTENGDLATHLKCKHCGESVERGIITVSEHWLKCTHRRIALLQKKTFIPPP